MHFRTASVTVKRNQTIRFGLNNVGRLKHAMVLGTVKALKAHAARMQRFPEMEHADPNQASVEPGQTGELLWRFTKAGRFDFACLPAGHFEAGMKGRVGVSGAGAAAKVSALSRARLTQIVYQADPGGDTRVAQGGRADNIDTADMTRGEVRKVDKVTIRHGEIRNFDMPGMPMLFQVADPSMLEAVKAGDRVQFRPEQAGGTIVVTEIRVVP